MKLDLTYEQKMLRESVERLFEAESSPAHIRAAELSGFDPSLWMKLVSMSIVSMRVPEEAGGPGMGLFDAVLVAETAGRHLASIPLAEAVPAARLLAELAEDAVNERAAALLASTLSGEVVVLLPQELQHDVAQAVPAIAGAIILALKDDEVISIRGLDVEAQANLGSDPYAMCILSGEHAVGKHERVAFGVAARHTFLAAIEEWKLLKAAMLVGLTRRAIEMAAVYATERQQFGKPIGSFQGIAHPLADALTEVDGAQLLVWRAIWAIAREDRSAAAYVSMAWWWATQTSARAVACALHTFGGYGVSLEYDIQLYYRRGKAWALVAGDPQRELYAVADRIWSDGAATPLPDVGEVTVEFDYGRDAQAFGDEVRMFFETHLTDELKAHAHHSVAGYDREFDRKLARAGLLYPHWPKEFGGRGKTVFDMAALAEVFEEFNWQRITGPVTNQVAQTLMHFGTEGAKKEVLPRFASGDAVACLGFTEPSSGSDVFAARTRAERMGEDWIINGQKIFTTAANVADYIFLLVRTAPELPKHAGLTLFLVPMRSQGIEIQAVHTLQDERTNITYLSDVRVPDRYRIGDVNGGIAVMSASLEVEHGGDQYRISFRNMYEHAVQWACSTRQGSRLLIENADVRRRLARVAVHTTIAKDLCYRSLWASANRMPGRAAFGPMSKLFSTETYQADAADLMDLAAPRSLFRGNQGLGHLEIGYRQSIGMTIYGGTSEVHRSLIAEQGLGMPRSRS